MLNIDSRAAYREISTRIHKTPVLASDVLSARLNCHLFLKCEHLQRTGSFKVRGALNKIASLTPEQLSGGISTVSAGNHAMAVAWAGGAIGAKTVVCMPKTAPKVKIDGSLVLGADVRLFENSTLGFAEATRLEAEEGFTFLHPFNDFRVIEGQGTVGVELLDQIPDLDVVVVGIGGGALCAGIAHYIKTHKPEVKIYGVEPEGAASMRDSFDAGEPVSLDSWVTIADGLAAPFAGKIAYSILKDTLEDIVLVSESEIAGAVKATILSAKQYVEPAGAAPLAALLSGKISVEPGSKVVCVCSGGNMDLGMLDVLEKLW